MSWQGPLTIGVWSSICPMSQASHTPPSRHCFPGFRPYPPGRGGGRGALTIVPQPWRAQRPFPVTGLSLHHLLHPLPADTRPGTPKWKSWLLPPSLPYQNKTAPQSCFQPWSFHRLGKGQPHTGLSSGERDLGLDLHPPCPSWSSASILMLPERGPGNRAFHSSHQITPSPRKRSNGLISLRGINSRSRDRNPFCQVWYPQQAVP